MIIPVLVLGPHFSCMLDGAQWVLDISLVIFVRVFATFRFTGLANCTKRNINVLNCDLIILTAIACPEPFSKAGEDVDDFLKQPLLGVWIAIGWSELL